MPSSFPLLLSAFIVLFQNTLPQKSFKHEIEVFADTVLHDIEFTESDIRLGYNDDILRAETRMRQYLKSIKTFQTSHAKEVDEFHLDKKLDQLKSEIENVLSEIKAFYEMKTEVPVVFSSNNI
ncbi:hypothetical protein QR680_018814 [Steinernema hermaphroditum]|uniref:Uncharacterized protein n=1 Tax=Steinernema hermaphroditum TaxID=289476 RepID=A0AA39HL88_9BILA|nr:hypothetical protein QR680_018814 [Steinernema hermaphroditum]